MQEASEKLHVSQSAISLSNKSLAEELGVELFSKQGRVLELTDAGRRFLSGATEILQSADDLKKEMDSRSKNRKRTVRLMGEAWDFASEAHRYFLTQEHPYKLSITSGNREKTKSCLLGGDADIAVTLFDDSSGDARSIPVLSDRFFLLVNRTHRFSGRDCVSLREIAGESLITAHPRDGLYVLFHSILAQAGVNPEIAAYVGSPESLEQMVAQNKGISFIPECNANSETATLLGHSGFCRAIPFEEPYCRRTIYVTYLKGAPQGRIKDALDFLVEFGRMAQENMRYP
jgi:DNA-binding transcriptional LysR family regulator